jgi:hypothetical protein
MDALDPLDQALGVGAAAEGGAGDELRGAAQAAQHVGLEVGVVPHARQWQRMQHLQQQSGHAAGEHGGEIAVDLPGRRVRTEQAGVARRLQEIGTAGAAADGEDVGFDALAQEFHGSGKVRRAVCHSRAALPAAPCGWRWSGCASAGEKFLLTFLSESDLSKSAQRQAARPLQ